MGTWIGHLRVAERLLEHRSYLDPAYFAFGSLAPDCGRRAEDGSGFVPPKKVSHFLVEEGELATFRDLAFYRRHLSQVDKDEDLPLYSFLLGYFLHLTVDGLWHDLITVACRRDYADLIAEKGREAWWMMKDDWYGLDVQYAQANRGSLFWTEVIPFADYRACLPFQNESDLTAQMEFIKDYYADPKAELLERDRFPYLSERTMDQFVADAVRTSLEVLDRIEEADIPEGVDSSLDLLPARERTPYPPPLGEA